MEISLKQVPKEIREHFGSEQTTAFVSQISKEADIVQPRLLAKTLYLLEIKGLDATNLMEAIAKNLEVNVEKAKAIAKEIKDKILEPKRYALAQWGVDIKLIDVTDARPLSEFAPKEGKLQEKTISLENLGERVQITAEKIPETPKPISPPPMPATQKIEIHPVRSSPPQGLSGAPSAGETSNGVKPLILHQEKPLTEEVKKPGAKVFSFPFEFFKTKQGGGAQKPVTAKIETLETETAEKEIKQIPPTLRTETPQKRLVNYTEFRTPLSPFGKEGEEIINLEKLAGNQSRPQEERGGL